MLYAQEERFTLYHGDNREVLKELADNSIDSIVTDPPYELGFMGKSWDASGIAFNVEVWQECLRVLKPGGHLLAFSGSRTYHRMAVAIEDAGFEIRDQIMWIYGSGFPKSHNIAKAIDKNLGAPVKVGKAFVVAGEYNKRNLRDPEQGEAREEMRHNAITAEAKEWQGWGTALKPAHEPIVVARKPLIGTVAANVLTYGTGGLNIDGARVGNEGGTARDGKANQPNDAGWENMRGHGIAELNTGRWPANVIHDGSDEVVELFPDSRGNGAVGGGEGGIWTTGNKRQVAPGYSDSGSAARFFYCAKANKRDRNEGLDEFEERTYGVGALRDGGRKSEPRSNHHPTVKPTDLMRYLCRLITPPNGIVLDPFMGSGSTGKAAVYEKFNFVGIELTDEYLPIAKARIEFALVDESDKLL